MKITVDRRTSSLFIRFTDSSQLFFSKVGMKLTSAAAEGTSAHRFAIAMASRLGWDNLVKRKGWPISRPECSGDWFAVDHEKTSAILRAILRHAETLPAQDPDVADAFRVFRDGLSDCSDIPEPAPQDRRLRLVLIGVDFWQQDAARRLKRVSEIATLVAQDPALVVVWQSPKHEGFEFSLASIFVQKLQAKWPSFAVAQTDEATAHSPAEPVAHVHEAPPIEALEVVTDKATDITTEKTADVETDETAEALVEEAAPEPVDQVPYEDPESQSMGF
ncbi:hypothetical protein [Roseicyclus marinus]|uniref:hypothetical protein n=1 Tax=Roseicyclus marinus TaxID=2161673 RepID=UPI0024104E67|nr:hypothetical protein [Roseicyclus marinus]MDG3039789.1 hypothetical protein [Roseicyclus marinus]